MSDVELDGDVSDEEVCSLLESSIREIEEENGVSETSTYVVRKKRVHGDEEEEEEGEESPEQLRQKVWQLQEYVRELTKYYGELMEAFEELKGRQGGDSVGDGVQGEERVQQRQLEQLQSENEQLKESLEKTGMVQEQVSCLFRIIDDGVKTGHLKLSELSHLSSELPFPTHDVQLNTAEEQQEEEGEGVGDVRNEMERMRSECESLAMRLSETEENLLSALQQRNQLEAELQSSKVEGKGLKTEVASLSSQLTEAQRQQTELAKALNSTRQAMDIYQETTRRDLEHRDDELEHLRGSLEEKRQSLEEVCEVERGRVSGVEAELEKAQDEINLLQKQVEELVPEAEEGGRMVEQLEHHLQSSQQQLETLQKEKDNMEQNLEDRIAELQAGIAAAVQEQHETLQETSDHKLQLDTLRDKQTSLQDDVHRSQQLLQEKEEQLLNMMTSLQVTAAQIAGLRRHGDEAHSVDGVWPSDSGELVKVVEREVEEVRMEWAESRAAITHHQTIITKMTGRLEQLQSDIIVREKQVTELEQLVSSARVSQADSAASLQEREEHVQELEEQIDMEKNERERMEQELAAAAGNKEETKRILTQELERQESSLQQLHTENKTLQEQLADVSSEVTVMQAARKDLQEEFDRLVLELEGSQSCVLDLERQVRGEEEKREQELTRCADVINDLQQQLATTEQKWTDTEHEAENNIEASRQERVRAEQMQTEIKQRERLTEELQEKTSLLSQQYLEAQEEADRQSSIVSSLETQLVSSNSQCHVLQQEFTGVQACLKRMEEQLDIVKTERDSLTDKIISMEEGELGKDVRISEIEMMAEEDRRRSESEVEQWKTKMKQLQTGLEMSGIEREKLEFRISSQNDDIDSLQRQVGSLQTSGAESAAKLTALESLLAESHASSHQLEEELTTAEERQLSLEQSRSVLESVGAERLATITLLQSEVEAARVREQQVKVMAEKLATLGQLLRTLQDELETAQQDNRQLEDARQTAEALAMQTETQLVSERREREGERREREEKMWKLTQQLQALEEVQTQTQAKLEMSGEKSGSLRSEIEMSKKKERLWSSELTQLTSDLQLAREKMAQLEREKAGLKAELTRVTLLLEHTQGELASSRAGEELAGRQVEEGRERLEGLERELRDVRREAAALKGQLAATEESHDHLRHRLGLMEEEYDGLQQSTSHTETQLKTTKTNLEDRKAFCEQLQEECENMSETVGGWAETQRSNTALLLQRISEQEVQLQSLRANQQDLEARNSSILKRNQRLQEELDKKTQDLETAIANSSSSSSMLSTNHPSSLTHITATIDLDLSKLRSLGVQNSSSSSTSVSHHASAIASVPLQFNSQYCSTMEEGLSVVEEPGMVGDGTSAEQLDKDFWIKRAGELSIQLQQSSDYWSQKVRDLSIQLEKQHQLKNKHTDFSD